MSSEAQKRASKKWRENNKLKMTKLVSRSMAKGFIKTYADSDDLIKLQKIIESKKALTKLINIVNSMPLKGLAVESGFSLLKNKKASNVEKGSFYLTWYYSCGDRCCLCDVMDSDTIRKNVLKKLPQGISEDLKFRLDKLRELLKAVKKA